MESNRALTNPAGQAEREREDGGQILPVFDRNYSGRLERGTKCRTS